jgi:lysozyme
MIKKRFSDWDVDCAKPLIRDFEGLVLKAYRCPAGVWTIGYGHTAGVKPGQEIDEIAAELLLDADLKFFAVQMAPLIKVPVTEGQAGALLSFAFNEGIGSFKRSTLLRLLNQGMFVNASYEFKKWKYAAGRELPGLVRRREAEAALFRQGM